MATWKKVLTEADIIDEDGFGTDSASKVPTQQSVKAYVDAQTHEADTVRTVTAGGNTLASSETLAFTAGDDITITESGGAVTLTPDNDDVNVTNLTARLPQITTSVTLGDASDVNITTAGALLSTGNLTVGGNEIKASNGTTCITTTTGGSIIVAADLQVSGNNISGSAGSNIFTFSGANVTAEGNLTVDGDLTVSGSTTTISTTELEVEDEKIILGVPNSAFADDAAAVSANDGGGIAIVTDSAAAGNYANLTWNTSKNQTGWCVEDTQNAGLYEIATMGYANSSAPTGDEQGVGGFVYDTGSDTLYIRTA